MSEIIRIKKGLNIRLEGEAEQQISEVKPTLYAVKPTDFIGVFPKMEVEEGAEVKAGTVLFHDKHRPDIRFTSPVSGTVAAIKRGEKRLLLEVVIRSDGRFESIDFGASNPLKATREQIVEKLMTSGMWAMLRQRPYSVIADAQQKPKAIFVSAFDTAPLAPDYNYVLQGQEQAFQTGLDVLTRLTDGKVHLSVNAQSAADIFMKAARVCIHQFEGPHPAGNIGTQINKISPINKGETVWYCNPQEVASIGRLFLTGQYDSTRIYAVTGSETIAPHYFKAHQGAQIYEFVRGNMSGLHKRFVSGNILTGKAINMDGFMGFYDHQLCLIPEGNHHEFMGWIMPGLNKFSISLSFLSAQFPKKKFNIDTNLHGGRRAFVSTGLFEKVFPFDIYPMQLIKACIIGDIDEMEKLGIYEVDPEDFALCEFIDPSKTEIQQIIAQGLEKVRQENQ